MKLLLPLPRPTYYLGETENKWSPRPPLRVVPFITRVRIANFKNLRAVDTTLDAFNVLVGLNGSGKSNFIDALKFLTEAVTYPTIAQAVEQRGGIERLLSRVPDPTDRLAISVETKVAYGPDEDQIVTSFYGFEISSSNKPGDRPFIVEREECRVHFPPSAPGGGPKAFSVRRGKIDQQRSLGVPMSEIEPDRLYLPIASAATNLAPLFNSLRLMAFYNLELSSLRKLDQSSAGDLLGTRGENLGSLLKQMGTSYPHAKDRINQYMRTIVPGLSSVREYYEGSYLTAGMDQDVDESRTEIFSSSEMSDGTLRSAAILTLLFQPWVLEGRIPLIAIEEPELAIHPAGAGVLFDAMQEASSWVQIIATSHSGDLLDRDDFPTDAIRVVTNDFGCTAIGAVDEAGRKSLREALFTPGELLRADQLRPDQQSQMLSKSEAFDVFSDLSSCND